MCKTLGVRTTFGGSGTPLWRESHFEVKMYKTHEVRTTFGSWDVEKVHAVVARSTFRSQNVQNTRGSDHFWRFRCRKSARRLEKCTPLWREAHFEVKMLKTLGFGPLLEVQMSLHFASLHYTTWYYTPLHYITLHYTPQHYNYNYTTIRHYTPLHSTTLNYTTLHYITLHYTPLHYITLHYTPQHYNYNYTTTQLHSTTLHYTPLH